MEEKISKKPIRKAPRRKVCVFCVEKAEKIDYKDVAKLKKYVTEKGKILPRRMTGVCAQMYQNCDMPYKDILQQVMRRPSVKTN